MLDIEHNSWSSSVIVVHSLIESTSVHLQVLKGIVLVNFLKNSLFTKMRAILYFVIGYP